MAVTYDTRTAVLGREIGVLGEKFRHFGLDGLGEQSPRTVAQDHGQLVVKGSWLNQPNDVVSGHGISLLRWRSSNSQCENGGTFPLPLLLQGERVPARAHARNSGGG